MSQNPQERFDAAVEAAHGAVCALAAELGNHVDALHFWAIAAEIKAMRRKEVADRMEEERAARVLAYA